MKRKKVSTLIAAALALTMTVCSSSIAIAASVDSETDENIWETVEDA